MLFAQIEAESNAHAIKIATAILPLLSSLTPTTPMSDGADYLTPLDLDLEE